MSIRAFDRYLDRVKAIRPHIEPRHFDVLVDRSLWTRACNLTRTEDGLALTTALTRRDIQRRAWIVVGMFAVLFAIAVALSLTGRVWQVSVVIAMIGISLLLLVHRATIRYYAGSETSGRTLCRFQSSNGPNYGTRTAAGEPIRAMEMHTISMSVSEDGFWFFMLSADVLRGAEPVQETLAHGEISERAVKKFCREAEIEFRTNATRVQL